jgi:DNA-binding SARP family transcriptional activator
VAARNGSSPPQLLLMGGFELRCREEAVLLPLGAQRVLAFLALRDAPLMRTYIGETLWFESHLRRAGANLRSAVWRVRRLSDELLDASGNRLKLAPGVRVDVNEGRALARRLLDRSVRCAPGDLGPAAVAALSADLLPEWSDDWLLLERDRWNQVRVHALEAQTERLLGLGNYSQAVEAALAAVGVEPLRESAHRLLIRVHAAEGNWSEALSQYHRYRRLAHRELRIAPTDLMEKLMTMLAPH